MRSFILQVSGTKGSGLREWAKPPLQKTFSVLLPHDIKYRRGLAMTMLFVRPSVRLSVCLSVTRVICDKTKQ